jgi:LacI family transcriptional regulator, repressor for deo operon, udp, cdd, tsx, nupC, and nupG
VSGFKPDKRKVRIAEVAALAGVSTATVSRAMSVPGKLRADTLARVAEAVRRTGYSPNLAARTLQARRTMLVLVVVPDIANPFFSDVLRGIDEGLSRHGSVC